MSNETEESSSHSGGPDGISISLKQLIREEVILALEALLDATVQDNAEAALVAMPDYQIEAPAQGIASKANLVLTDLAIEKQLVKDPASENASFIGTLYGNVKQISADVRKRRRYFD